MFTINMRFNLVIRLPAGGSPLWSTFSGRSAQPLLACEARQELKTV